MAQEIRHSPTVTICICTRDRPDVLQVCLSSIADSSRQPDQVFVSDDSDDGILTRELCAKYPFVSYLAGPRKGLCANRNFIISKVTTSHVSLLDDDGLISKTFILQAMALVEVLTDTTIVTGSVLDHGRLAIPGSPNFWGHFTEKRNNNSVTTVQLNCNLFPTAAFALARFDESITYGFEDMDLCSHLLSVGYRIHWDPTLLNQHLPPIQNRQTERRRFRQWEQARYYTSLKRYFLWENQPLKGVAYVLLAPIYTIAFTIRWCKWQRLPEIPIDFYRAMMQFKVLVYRSPRKA